MLARTASRIVIVTFITEQHGKVTGIGKGAKNSRRRFAGTLAAVRARAGRLPPAPGVGPGLPACAASCSRRCAASPHDIDRFAAGSYVLDLTDRMVLGRESGSEVYGLVREALALLAGGAPPDPLLRAVEMHLLRASGYAPAFDRCRGCGTPADTALFLVVERGGLALPALRARAASRCGPSASRRRRS